MSSRASSRRSGPRKATPLSAHCISRLYLPDYWQGVKHTEWTATDFVSQSISSKPDSEHNAEIERRRFLTDLAQLKLNLSVATQLAKVNELINNVKSLGSQHIAISGYFKSDDATQLARTTQRKKRKLANLEQKILEDTVQGMVDQPVEGIEDQDDQSLADVQSRSGEVEAWMNTVHDQVEDGELVEEEEPASATPQEEAPTITTNINQSLAVRLSTGRSIEEVIVAWREGVKDGREHCVHSWIANLNDAQLCNYATPKEIKEIKAKWLEGSPAASSQKQMARGQYDSLDSQDLLAACRYLDDLTSKIPGHFTAASMYEHETGLPIRREGEHVQTHVRTLIVREMVISMLRAWTHGTNSSSGSEALVMRQSWDSLFDRLAFGVVKTGAAEETVMASAYRRKQQGGSQQRGKQADKCWRTSNGYELCWQEAAKGGAVADWSKYIADSLKIYKGCKDLSDFITMRTRKSIEVFGIITSGTEASIISCVRLPSGAVLQKELVRMNASSESYQTFAQWIRAVKVTLSLVMSMSRSAVSLLQECYFSDSDEDPAGGILVTCATPKKS
ncbi:hypothetical protein DFS34DRAFT_654772 [Phlyctochytrium arcticum]|nr:hypothetical protein DFS34DRAFT_654772 [Phlyctochytrium arcticum]